ncbi:hypothetical protein UPYG_G00063830 [Umbra pygmaea]|uniref:Uncharacterized protein n=1 Tax=Umbra pygmaea TaxID=75934 RepID=A0ABD0XZD4_UMBPY
MSPKPPILFEISNPNPGQHYANFALPSSRRPGESQRTHGQARLDFSYQIIILDFILLPLCAHTTAQHYFVSLTCTPVPCLSQTPKPVLSLQC